MQQINVNLYTFLNIVKILNKSNFLKTFMLFYILTLIILSWLKVLLSRSQ